MERYYTKMMRLRRMILLEIKLERSTNSCYFLAKQLGSMGLDILSYQDQTSDYDYTEERRRK